MHVKAVLSDSDGTLVDTVQLIRHGQFATLKKYLAQKNVPSQNVPHYSEFVAALNESVGGSAKNTLEKTAKLLFHNRSDILDAFDFDALHDLLNPIQDSLASTYVKPYDGLSELLHSLGSLHIKFGIFTSGSKHHIVRNLGVALPELVLSNLYQDSFRSEDEKFNIFVSRFKETFHLPDFSVVTCELVDAHKPDPASLQYAMEKLAVKPDECLVLGDHAVDMQSGANAGISQRVGISHGFHDSKALELAGATKIITSLDELKDMLKSSV
ncbi:HAD-IA family hydrolase [Candidatus Saccharibacteria bacterium]|nr:MAG: HAD-IA family hydrolase [Candidatus Saccharibacteria bacterium]